MLEATRTLRDRHSRLHEVVRSRRPDQAGELRLLALALQSTAEGAVRALEPAQGHRTPIPLGPSPGDPVPPALRPGSVPRRVEAAEQ